MITVKNTHKNNIACRMASSSSNSFVAVHVGAGNHSRSNEEVYKSVCKLACQQAMEILNSKKSVLEAVTVAVMALENSECTNAGYGSNLTMDGRVECDASAMDGQSLLFGAVGALSGVANPCAVARLIIEEQKMGPLPFGRIRPSVLVGEGAKSYCKEADINTKEHLISGSAFRTYNKYKRKCQRGTKLCLNNKKSKIEEMANSRPNLCLDVETPLSPAEVQDTVGAVCVDMEGNMAAVTSSGGIWLKHAGRLGPAAIYGAGCWAQNQTGPSNSGVAVVTSGCGEDLIRTVLAKTCGDALRCAGDLSDTLSGSEFLASKSEKFGGVLLLRAQKQEDKREVEVSWIHSTASMCLAYMSSNKSRPTVFMSRLSENCVPGQSYTMGGHVAML